MLQIICNSINIRTILDIGDLGPTVMSIANYDAAKFLAKELKAEFDDWSDYIHHVDFASEDPEYISRVMRFMKKERFVREFIETFIESDMFTDNLIIQALLHADNHVKLTKLDNINYFVLDNLRIISPIVIIEKHRSAHKKLKKILELSEYVMYHDMIRGLTIL